MLIDHYTQVYNNYFDSKEFIDQSIQALELIKGSKRIFFIGNGGSNAICSHMMEDYAKIGRFQTFSFSDAALITCYANDYGYENALQEWLKIYFREGDILVAISSSGKSANILNAVEFAKSQKGKVLSLSGFKNDNPLKGKGHVNFYIPAENYGIVECFHQVILHVLLDEIAKNERV